MRRALFKQVYYFICRPPITSGTCLSFIAGSGASCREKLAERFALVRDTRLVRLSETRVFPRLIRPLVLSDCARLLALVIGQTHAKARRSESGRSNAACVANLRSFVPPRDLRAARTELTPLQTLDPRGRRSKRSKQS